ncbi:probable carboxypeptidase [Phialocephala subalpina]|uniref:Probable carboxypeptidase n=1 Tax=Phialocephala subalpina TaxID=576137 RepID=A0A1L7XLD9_9HELO|nr:probable carboxypeptidase [Phialocephala subalpina]
MKASLLLTLSSLSVGFAKVSYDGAKALRIPVGEDVEPLMQIIDELSLPVWKGVVNGVPVANGYVDLVVPAAQLARFNNLTTIVGMETEVMHEDLGLSIAEEGRAVGFAVPVAAANLTWFNAYHAYADHLQFLNDLVSQYPANSEIVVAGNSNAGRPITGIHFYGSGGNGSKPAVVLHGTVHAREWITTMTTEYLAYTLLSGYATNTQIKDFVDKYDFYVFPVVNPDGFVYTQTNDRLWRKNRQTVSSSSCVGRDINRNWPYQWSVTGGASTNPCDETFKGLAGGDATENKVLLAHINKLAAGNGVQLYIDIHSYSQLFMTPYGYSCTALAPQNTVLQTLARGVAAAIKSVYGTTYTYGPVCTTIYKATGSSVDYVNDVTGAKYTFTIELRDTGTNGFVLPASQILPTGVETWEGFKYLLVNMS